MEKIDIKDFAPIGTKECQMKCKRIPVKSKDGVKIVCTACKRIVMER